MIIFSFTFIITGLAVNGIPCPCFKYVKPKDLLVKILSTIIKRGADSFLYALPFKVAFINLP